MGRGAGCRERSGTRSEGVGRKVQSGYCRLQTPLGWAVGGTAGSAHGRGACGGGGGGVRPPFYCIPDSALGPQFGRRAVGLIELFAERLHWKRGGGGAGAGRPSWRSCGVWAIPLGGGGGGLAHVKCLPRSAVFSAYAATALCPAHSNTWGSQAKHVQLQHAAAPRICFVYGDKKWAEEEMNHFL